MYDIIPRRRLSTVLRYIFDFLPKEETSIHLNTKKAVLSDRRNSDTEPYIMLNIFFVEDIFSPRWAEANKSRRCVLPGLRLSGSGQTSFPLPLFSRLSVSAFLLHHRMRFKTLQYRHGSVTATDKSRRRTLSGICLPVPGKLRFPFRSFLAFRLPLFTAPPYAFQNSSIPTRLRYGVRQSRRRTLLGLYLPSPRQTSFPLPLFSRLSVSAFYRATVCVSKLFNTAPAPLRRQTNQDAVHCPAFVFPVPGT